MEQLQIHWFSYTVRQFDQNYNSSKATVATALVVHVNNF